MAYSSSAKRPNGAAALMPAAVVQSVCSAIKGATEAEGFAMLVKIAEQSKAQGAKPAAVADLIRKMAGCRTWQTKLADVKQLMARYGATTIPTSTAAPRGNGNGTGSSSTGSTPSTPSGTPTGTPTGGGSTSKPGGCKGTCRLVSTTPHKPCTDCEKRLMDSVTINPNNVNDCGVYRGPSVEGLAEQAQNLCGPQACQAGYAEGLQTIPQLYTAPPGISTITVQYNRSARLLALSLIRRDTTWTVDSVLLGNWKSANAIQYYDNNSNQSTFAAQDPNTLLFPSRIYLEDGDDEFSPILHFQNPLPPMIAQINIGFSNSYVTFQVNNTLAVAQEIPMRFWVYFGEGTGPSAPV